MEEEARRLEKGRQMSKRKMYKEKYMKKKKKKKRGWDIVSKIKARVCMYVSSFNNDFLRHVYVCMYVCMYVCIHS